jgi:hypothetical protein
LAAGISTHGAAPAAHSASYGFGGFNGRTLADNAPEVMLSLVLNPAGPSGLKPAVVKELRDAAFPYVVPSPRLVGALDS